MTLKHTLKLLTQLEAEGKVKFSTLSTLYDANGDIALTVRVSDVATREQFVADAMGTVDEAAPDRNLDLSGKPDLYDSPPREAAPAKAKGKAKK